MDEIKVSSRMGEEFEVRLPSNPSTGYAWQVAAAPDGVRLIDSTFISSKSLQPVAGAVGEQVFRFLADQPGKYKLEMELKRAWEQQPIQIRLVEVVVQHAINDKR
jgi:inhibitor of cysteine peptidase